MSELDFGAVPSSCWPTPYVYTVEESSYNVGVPVSKEVKTTGRQRGRVILNNCLGLGASVAHKYPCVAYRAKDLGI